MKISNYYENYWSQLENNKHEGHAVNVPEWSQKEIRTFYNSIERYVGKTVLDLGAGEGTFANFLKNNCLRVKNISALEISQNAIKKGKDNYSWLNYIQGSADDVFPFKDNQFDTIFMLDVIEHLVDIDTSLSECWRVLKKGGKLILITPDFNFIKKLIVALIYWEKMFYPNNPHIRFFTRKSMKNIMQKHKFKEVFYKWGLNWFRMMPQNMYTVYEKK